jgi:hypothetical protein
MMVVERRGCWVDFEAGEQLTSLMDLCREFFGPITL